MYQLQHSITSTFRINIVSWATECDFRNTTSTCNPYFVLIRTWMHTSLAIRLRMQVIRTRMQLLLDHLRFLVHTEYDSHTIVHDHTSEHRGRCLNGMVGNRPRYNAIVLSCSIIDKQEIIEKYLLSCDLKSSIMLPRQGTIRENQCSFYIDFFFIFKI